MSCSIPFARKMLRGCICAALCLGGIAHAEDFDWRNINGQNYVTAIRNQGTVGTCWAFAPVAAAEAKYKITRNDPNFSPDFSEQNLVSVGTMGDIVGGYEYQALNYITSTGIVSEAEVPYTAQNTSPNYPLQSGWQNRVFKSTHNTSITSTTANFKAKLKANGPIVGFMQVDTDWYPAGASNRGYHAILVVGFHDDSSLAAGGYWIIKNSWGTSWGTDGGYGKILYGNLEKYNRANVIDGAVYYTGSMASATWNGTSGTWAAGNPANWTSNSAPYSWQNQETAATFGPGASTNAVAIANTAIAHSITLSPGATGYTFSGGSLTVTAGGITANESATINSPLTVGGPQTWTVAAGRTLAVSSVNTNVSPLTIAGDGNTLISGPISGVGAMTKTGNGALTLASSNSSPGKFLISGGAVAITDESALGANPALYAADQLKLSGGTLQTSGAFALDDSNRGVTLTSPGGTFLTTSGTLTISRALAGSGSLTKTGPGALCLRGGSINYTGTTTVSEGTFQLVDATAFRSAITVSGGSLSVSGTTDIADTSAINLAPGAAYRREILAGRSYSTADLRSQLTLGLKTSSKILGGANAAADPAETVSMSWKARPAEESPADGGRLASDVLSLDGLLKSGGSSYHGSLQTDLFTLQLSYDPASVLALTGFSETAAAQQGLFFLTALDLGADSLPGGTFASADAWRNAIDGNFGAQTIQFYGRAYNAVSDFHLGYYGVDTSQHTVWAVLNHATDFAVGVAGAAFSPAASVPLPSSLYLASLGLALPLLRRLRRR